MQVVGSREMRCPENDGVTAGDAMRYDMMPVKRTGEAHRGGLVMEMVVGWERGERIHEQSTLSSSQYWAPWQQDKNGRYL